MNSISLTDKNSSLSLPNQGSFVPFEERPIYQLLEVPFNLLSKEEQKQFIVELRRLRLSYQTLNARLEAEEEAEVKRPRTKSRVLTPEEQARETALKAAIKDL